MTLEDARKKAAKESIEEEKNIFIFKQKGSDQHFTSSSEQMTGGIKLERWAHGDLCQQFEPRSFEADQVA